MKSGPRSHMSSQRFRIPESSCSGQAGSRLDLKAANRQLLRPLGLTESAGLDECTHCRPEEFFSARRDRTTGRNLALILRRAT